MDVSLCKLYFDFSLLSFLFLNIDVYNSVRPLYNFCVFRNDGANLCGAQVRLNNVHLVNDSLACRLRGLFTWRWGTPGR